jgi:ATP-binding cassette subfamily B protein
VGNNMAFRKLDLRGGAFRAVLGFLGQHWRRQPWRIAWILSVFLLATLADVLTPLFAGKLVDAVAGPASSPTNWDAALLAFGVLVGLGLCGVLLRQLSFMSIITLTLRMMTDIASGAFHRLQRFSTDWHANSFAGSTVRKVTRGMWALDLLNDTLLIALFPSVVMLIGSTVLLGFLWPLMGLIVGLGSLLYIAVTVFLSVGYVAPAASLANAWDTRMGGALADAISCNAVVKGFGAEDREEERLATVIDKWRSRTRRTWKRGTLNGTTQQAMLLLLRGAIIGAAVLLWARGMANAGDIAMVLTTFFVLQGYLRDVGMHIRNLQRSVNDMEELVEIESQPLGIEDRPSATPIRIGAGRIDFDHVNFHYGSHTTPLYRDFSVSIEGGEKVGLVGHFRLRQDHLRQADPAPLRRHRRRHRHRRPEHRRGHASFATSADRHRAAGAAAVPSLAGREHRLCPPRRQPRRGRACRPPRQRA